MRHLLLQSLGVIGLVVVLCSPSKTSLANAFRNTAFVSNALQLSHSRNINLHRMRKVDSSNDVIPTQEQEWDVERYQTQHSFVWKYGASLLDHLVDDMIHPGDCILDIGCGSGELTAKLYDRAQEILVLATNKTCPAAAATTTATTLQPITVMGMDANADMIATASKQYPHLQFFQGDVRNFELPGNNDGNTDDDDSSNNKVDVIFSNAALHWIPPCDVDQAIGAMSRALVKGGRFVVEFGGKGNVEKITLAAQHVLLAQQQQQQKVMTCQEKDDISCRQQEELAAAHHDSYHGWYFPSISEFTTMLEKHDIEVTSATLFDRPTPLDDGVHGMSNWLRMFGSHLLSLPNNSDNVVATAAATTKPMGNSNISNDVNNNNIEQDREQVIRQIHDELMRRGDLWNGQQWTADYRRIRVIGKKK